MKVVDSMAEVRIARVELIAGDVLQVHCDDDQSYQVALDEIPRLASASLGVRYQWRIDDDGYGIQWVALALRLSIDDLRRLARPSK